MTRTHVDCRRSATARNSTLRHRILVILESASQEPILRGYTSAMAQQWQAEVSVFRAYLHRNGPAGPNSYGMDDQAAESVRERIHAGLYGRIMEVSRSIPFETMVAAWPGTEEGVGTLASLVKQTGATAVLVRHREQPIRRVLVPAGGGAHALEGVRIAKALAASLAVNSRVLRIVQPESGFRLTLGDLKRQCRRVAEQARVYLDVADAQMPIQVCLGGDVADEIICRQRPGDLIVTGGSGQWLMEHHAFDSIPGRIVSGANGPVVVVLTSHGRPSALTDVFWDRTIRVGLQAHDKAAAIERLVDALVEARQIPSMRRSEVVEAVMQRERAGATYIGNGTAVPHAAMGGFRGLVGMLGVFADGVSYGRADGDRAFALFLLLTPKESYEAYLPILGRIARFMDDPHRRQKLAEARNPSQVEALLSRAESDWKDQDS